MNPAPVTTIIGATFLGYFMFGSAGAAVFFVLSVAGMLVLLAGMFKGQP